MKKVMLCLGILLLVGCGEKKVEPVKDTIDTIQDSKKSIAITKTQSMLKEAEMKFLTLEKTCLDAKDLSQNAESGTICLDDSSKLYAKDVQVEGYICNGYKTSLNCAGGSNDK